MNNREPPEYRQLKRLRGRGCPSPARALCENDKGPGLPGPLKLTLNRRLLQRVRDRNEVAVQLAAEAVDGGDDRDCDAGGDQAVFDGGGAGPILHETRKRIFARL